MFVILNTLKPNGKMTFTDKTIFVSDHAAKRFIERANISPLTSIGTAKRKVTTSLKRSEYIASKRIMGLGIKKGATYAFDPIRNLLYALESISWGTTFRVITCLTKEEFEIL